MAGVLLVSLIWLVSDVNAFFPATYKFNDPVPVRVSNIAPFYNPIEKYDYDRLPWPCKPAHPHSNGFSLGEYFNGERNRESLYQIHFQRSTNTQTVCGEGKSLSSKNVNSFIDAIDNDYQYEMWIDDIPVFGRIGFEQTTNHIVDGKLYFLITHRHFNIHYNSNQVIRVNISTRLQPGHYVEIQSDQALDKVHFTYSVTWIPTDIPYSQRFQLIEGSNGNNITHKQIEIHWLWILNTSFLVILLAGLLSMILLRTLKNDISRYLSLDVVDQDDNQGLLDDIDESGWKRIRFDVFRTPKYPYLFSSIVGVGAQILWISFFLLILAVIGYFYSGNHGRMYVAAIFLYSLTAYSAGYISSAKAKELHNDYDWMKSCGYTLCLFSGPYLCVFALVNSVSIYYRSAIALPFSTILTIILLYIFVTLPLTAFGSFRAKKANIPQYPCHIKKIPRPLPSNLPWYYNNYLLLLSVGFLQFMSIYVELHTIFNSIWGHQVYTLFGILLLTFLILLIVTSCLVILLTYFQLNSENYKWWWSSLIRGSSCGIFMYIYAIYYWIYTSQMSSSPLQFTVYFCYTFIISYAVSLMLSSVAHWSSRWFVIKIYGNSWYD